MNPMLFVVVGIVAGLFVMTIAGLYIHVIRRLVKK